MVKRFSVLEVIDKMTESDQMILKKQSVVDLINEIDNKNIKLWIDGDSLRYKAPVGTMTNEVLNTLKDRKAEIVEYLKSKSTEGVFCTPIKRATEKEYYSLSPAQMRMFLTSRMYDKSTAYNLTQALYIHGNIDAAYLKKVLKKLTQRHDAFRTTFDIIDGKPVQKIHDEVDFEVQYQECEDKKEIIDTIIRDFIKPYNIAKLPLFRFKLLKLANNNERPSYILIQDMHHIISDGISEALLINEVNSLYSGRALYDLKIQYKDYVEWHQKLISSNEIACQRQYWLNKLSGEIPLLNLPADYKRPANFSYKGNSIKLIIDKELTDKLYKLARDNRVTMFTMLLSGYSILLSRYTGQNDIIIGTPIAGRRHTDLNAIIGVFLNTLALRVLYKPETTIIEFLRDIGHEVLEAFDNQDYPFENIVEDLTIKRDPSRNPLLDTLIIFQNINSNELAINDLKISKYSFEKGMAQYDLSLIGFENKEGIEVEINYCTSLFREETIIRFGEHLLNILEYIVENPNARLYEIEILSEKEKTELLYDFNKTEVQNPIEKTIQELIEEQVIRAPESVAITFEDKNLLYSELNRRANSIAKKLREMGIERNNIVAIMVNRSFDMIAGILGILKSGGAYLPIDPEYPEDRINYMLEDSGTQIMLTTSSLCHKLKFNGETILLDMDIKASEIDEKNPDVINSSRDLAYVIYTSGSTGKPKGVMLEHRSVVNFITGIKEKISFSAESTILGLTTISFDIFVLETLLPLAQGSRIVLTDENQQRDPRLLSKVILENKINMLQATPSRMKMLMSIEACTACLQKLKYIMIGGEAFPLDLLQNLKKLTNAEIFNMYGPTETTVWSTIKDLTNSEKINIGKPIANTSIYIVNSFSKLQPVGVAGELCIGGHGLARGYIGRPELTDEKFPANPFSKGERMYRTGDAASWQPNGEIDFLGRIDSQVKIRGYRIELGEIENLLMKFEGIKSAVVTVKENEDKVKYLCAYYVSDKNIDSSSVRAYLNKALPEYMIPSNFISMDKLPQTPNGKIDRKALPEPERNISSCTELSKPTNDIEEKISEIWKRVLNVKEIGIDDDFFEYGGNSLSAIKLEVEMEKSNLVVHTSDILRLRTVRGLASLFLPEKSAVCEINEMKAYDFNQNTKTQDIIIYENNDCKILNGIQPFNDIFYKNCFYNAAFPVLKYYNKSVLLFLVNDVILYTKNKQGYINTEYVSIDPVEKLLNDEKLKYEIKGTCVDVIADVINAISKDRLPIVSIDCYYEPIKLSSYMKEHWNHSLLIYGYDKEQQVFHVIEHKHRDNLIYEKRILSFDDLKKSYNGYMENLANANDNMSYIEIYSDFVEIIDSQYHEENVDKFKNILAENTYLKSNLIFERLAVLRDFVKVYTEISMDESLLRRESQIILNNFNDIINTKSVEKYKAQKIFGKQSKHFKLAAEVGECWASIRNVLAKYQFSSVYDKGAFESSIIKLERIHELECLYINAILDLNIL